MISQELLAEYQATIGIECHVQLKTKTKLFAGVSNDAREAPPNTLVSHICFGLPGALPVLNVEAIHLASKAAFALNSRPQAFSKFDRKHYFYPDLPMGYQITQFDQPIIVGGTVVIRVDGGQPKNIGITRAHLEADAGKSTHPAGADYSLVDLNRAGTPLLEIVSEPDMHTSAEAKAYARELYLLMRYAAVSEANLYYGNMRFDVNVSVSKTNVMGTRSETKNLNSFKSVEKAVDYEIKRQIELLEKGQKIVQETRGWDDAKQKTLSQRTKENADDYRYMPDPDIPPITLSEQAIDLIKDEMTTMPEDWRLMLHKLGLDGSQIETLLDVQVDLGSKYLELIEQNIKDKKRALQYANWIINLEVPMRRTSEEVNKETLVDDEIRSELFSAVYKLVESEKLNSNKAFDLLSDLITAQKLPESIDSYAEKNGFIQLSDDKLINEIVQKVIEANPKAAGDVANGEMKVIGFLVGQVMKESAGKANPKIAQDLILKQLGLSH
ncbi:MAG: Asp-tRNA(Asn)/Glu-tRNA(Gln) amidotransferase subunit GatB [Candidatus Saccharimonadales bacterium]